MSLEDDLIKRFAGEQVQKAKEEIVENGEEFEPIIKNKGFVVNAVTRAQKKVEGNNFDQRKNTLRYDDVMNSERIALYKARQTVIDSDNDLTPNLLGMIKRTVDRTIDKYYLDSTHINYRGLIKVVRRLFDVDFDTEATINEYQTTNRGEKYKKSLLRTIEKNKKFDRLSFEQIKELKKEELKDYLYSQCLKEIENKREELISNADLWQFERIMILNAIDANWKDNIDKMEQSHDPQRIV